MKRCEPRSHAEPATAGRLVSASERLLRHPDAGFLAMTLTILLCVCFSNSFSQSDSLKHRFTVGISPLLYVMPNEDILYCEYQPKEKFSFELGGGIYNLAKRSYAEENASGFTVRAAIIKNLVDYSTKEGNPYLKLLIFYRHMRFVDRHYTYGADGIMETIRTIPDGSDRDNSTSKIGNEIKHEVCVEALLGRKILFGEKEHFFFDYYGGFGFRIKYRELSITQDHIPSSSLSPIDPPRNEIIISYLPSIHLGFNVGYTF